VAAATQGSPAVYDDVLLSAHMVLQHLLLIMVAPPLLILGRPVTLLLRVTCVRLCNHLKHVLRSRLVSALTWPPAAATLYAAVVIGTHLTPLMNLLLATMPVDTLVGVVLILASHRLFPLVSAYPDLHQGGLIMLAGGDLIMTVLAVALAVSVVQDRGTPRGDGPGDLDAYNAYLVSLDSRKDRPLRGNGTAPVPVHLGPAMMGTGSLVPNEPGYLPRPAVARGPGLMTRTGLHAARAQAPGYPYLQRFPEPFRALTARPVPPGRFR
jgi:cytochrome c oxidase assembly factor CtaG